MDESQLQETQSQQDFEVQAADDPCFVLEGLLVLSEPWRD